MGKVIKNILLTLLGLLIVVGVAFGLYVLYLESHWTRIDDNQTLTNVGASPEKTQLTAGETYTAMTYNIGFGAYTPDYTFFLDTGIMKDGTETVGTLATAVSEESVLACTEGAIAATETIADGSPADFLLFQEVDIDSDRSYHVNQQELITKAFPMYSAFAASDFHSGFLIYPFNDMHGAVQSELLTLSNVRVNSTVRRSYPIDESFPTRYFDLDRCFSVSRIAVSDGHDLVLINSHMSAYDEGGIVRAQQFDLLCSVLAEEYAAGNYVVAGADWNHALCGSSTLYESAELVPDWVVEFDEELLPDGFNVVRTENLEEVASCRNNDIPYEPGVSYTVTIDGFIVSDNVEATATNIDTGFAYSDHNPVLLSFKLGA